jgi:Ni/Co efflux regulator RcnB
MRKLFLFALLLMVWTGFSLAKNERDDQEENEHGRSEHENRDHKDRGRSDQKSWEHKRHERDHKIDDRQNSKNQNGQATPEIDPSSAASAVALLSGGVLVIRGRRKG